MLIEFINFHYNIIFTYTFKLLPSNLGYKDLQRQAEHQEPDPAKELAVIYPSKPKNVILKLPSQIPGSPSHA